MLQTPSSSQGAILLRVNAPVGLLRIRWSEAGIRRIEFESWMGTKYDDTVKLANRGSLHQAPALVRSALDQLREYFRGQLREFDVKVDLSPLSPFCCKVLRALMSVGYGSTITYGELARCIGSPRASRAVGRALGMNPVPIVVPCHRVVGRGGRLGGFTPGLELKTHLLALEAGKTRVG